MPRFFFHLVNATGHVRDEEGEEFPDIVAARENAVAGIRSIVSDECKAGRVDLRGRIEVARASGEVVQAVEFADAVEVLTGPPPAESDQT
jgi:hypothetical protein